MKTALISGIKGQLGSYLGELLLSKGYKVIGIERRSSSPDYSNIKHFMDHPFFVLEQGDITDFGSIARILKDHKPDEFYNLAAQSFVAASWDQPIATSDINYMGVANCLEAIRLVSPKTKFYQSSTSEVYGDVVTDTQDEKSPLRPRSPYGASKAASEFLLKVYKDSYGIFACFSRNFNFESPRRGKQFVTRKITNAIGEMYHAINHNVNLHLDNQAKFEYALSQDIIKPIHLGNLGAKRDWSHAKDIAQAIWLMMQEEKPDFYTIGSGHARSIRDFLDEAFGVVDVYDWSEFVEIDPKFYRPAEVNTLCGDATKARKKLCWDNTISFEELVKEMVLSDIELNAKKNSNVQSSS
jgi:GDPmannose 4,6-dehydratase